MAIFMPVAHKFAFQMSRQSKLHLSEKKLSLDPDWIEAYYKRSNVSLKLQNTRSLSLFLWLFCIYVYYAFMYFVFTDLTKHYFKPKLQISEVCLDFGWMLFTEWSLMKIFNVFFCLSSKRTQNFAAFQKDEKGTPGSGMNCR